MEYYGRRNRRGRDRRCRQNNGPQSFVVTTSQKRWSLIHTLSSVFIMTSLLAIIYLMLDYHCTACTSKCDLTNITRNIDNLSVNLAVMKDSYNDLEANVLKFSHELPRIQGQIEILEAIATNMESGDFQRPLKNLQLNNIDKANEDTKQPSRKNVSKESNKAEKY